MDLFLPLHRQGSGSFFAGCVIWEYEEVRSVMRRHMDRGTLWARRSLEPGNKRVSTGVARTDDVKRRPLSRLVLFRDC